MTMKHGALNIPVCATLLLSLVSCANIPTSAPIAPTVTLQSVKPLSLSFSKQKLAFQLEVNNPNAYDLPIQRLTFVANLENKEVAQGTSREQVTLPANGKATIEIIVNARIQRILGEILSLSTKPPQDLNYDLKGFVKLANWPLKIPFNTDGQIKGSKIR